MQRFTQYARVLAVTLAAMSLTFGTANQKKPASCATVKVDGQSLAMRGGPPVVWKADGTMANQRAVELHYGRAILANPGLTVEQKKKLLTPETAAELEAPWRTDGDPEQGDPRHPPTGGGGDDGPQCTSCPMFGCPCPCWGTLVFNSCADAALNCRDVSPNCPL